MQKTLNKNVFVLLGTNLGNRIQNLLVARNNIEITAGKIIAQSSIYQTAAWGNTDQPDFFNQVLQIKSFLEPVDLLREFLSIESQMGRLREIKWGPRLIDIDLLMFDSLVLQTAELTVPHPAMHLRRFTLEPLAEIAPGVIHPVFNQTVAALLANCQDPLPVTKVLL